ncbi:MAG TPA: triple tyrosine motif-containing protein, partial [Saprospiraceae bacterium]|nr:triple tyrosine motif-containing protein [Saprospiraceae bacterium]
MSVIDLKTNKIDFARYKRQKEIVPELSKIGLFSALVKDRHGNIIIGTWDRRYFAYNPETDFFKEYSAHTAYSLSKMGNQTRALIIDSKNRLWFATDSIVAYMDADSFINATPKSFRFKSFPITADKNNCITGFPAFCLYEDSKHNIWTGTNKGLYKISPDDVIEKFTNDPKNFNSINENDVRHICEDRKANIWLATNGGGINKFDPVTKKFIAFTMQNGLPDNAIYTMKFDDENNLWISCNRGLAKFNPFTSSVKKFSLYDGLQNYEYNTNAICEMPDGEFVFGGNLGVNVFKPNEIITKNDPPKIAICSFKIFNVEMPLPDDGIQLAYNKNNLTIEFSALSFYRNEENQYAYKMEEFDKDWIYCNNTHSISYNNLPPGNYNFKVKASNSAGVWNTTGISFPIIILPPWWQAWWARIIFLVIIFTLIFFVIQYRTKTLRTQRAMLEQKVGERTAELKQTQSLLVTQEKLASLGVLTAGIAHEIKNPLNFVTNFSDLSAKLIDEYRTTDTPEDKEEILDELNNNLSIINRHSHRANSIVENMLQHARAGKGEMQPTDINKTCNEYLDLAFQNARSRIPNFNCEIKKNLDPNLPKINAIPQDISRVMLNFYSNAFDAVKLKEKAIIEVSTLLVGNKVEIRIKDNGSGIPDNIKSNIFEPFFTTKPSGQGTGLGLSISYDIIKTH